MATVVRVKPLTFSTRVAPATVARAPITLRAPVAAAATAVAKPNVVTIAKPLTLRGLPSSPVAAPAPAPASGVVQVKPLTFAGATTAPSGPQPTVLHLKPLNFGPAAVAAQQAADGISAPTATTFAGSQGSGGGGGGGGSFDSSDPGTAPASSSPSTDQPTSAIDSIPKPVLYGGIGLAALLLAKLVGL